ncbi:hypothetical protein EfmJHP35_01060 [Enterococcus faecium]|nr:hypothetical protein EfmJHP35_01060 [Enterococcus faecium]
MIFPKVKAGAFSHEMDHKTKLQEVLQKSGDVSIEYRLINEEGPAHERVFWIEVYVDDQLIGTGQGKSKKLAGTSCGGKCIGSTVKVSEGKLCI